MEGVGTCPTYQDGVEDTSGRGKVEFSEKFYDSALVNRF